MTAERADAYGLLDKIALHGSPEIAREDSAVIRMLTDTELARIERIAG
jgi:hypothetical protein